MRLRCVLAALVLLAPPPAPAAPPPRPCADNALCLCTHEHFSCDRLPFHRFPDTDAGVSHVSVSRARLGTLGETALDGRRLRTLVLVASHLHHIESGALMSMTSTLASLDLGYNEFTEVPIEALRDLKVLNWLNLQNNYIGDLAPNTDWGFLADSLSSLSLSRNHLNVLKEGTLSSLRQLAHLDLDGNRLRYIAENALPSGLSVLRLNDNLLIHLPCDSLAQLPRLRHLHLRNNVIAPTSNSTCRNEHFKIDNLDLSHNELDDHFQLELQHKLQLKQLTLDLNEFTTVPSFVLDNGRLQKLSISYNNVSYLSDTLIHALKRDLEHLYMDYNELRSLPSSLSELTRLRHLSIAYNYLEELSDIPPRLHSLSLAGNYFTTFPSGIRGLNPGSLSYFDMSYNQISQITADMFGPWSDALETLSLKGNRIAQLPSDTFPATVPLRELILSFNDLYYIDSNAFANLTVLQVLELSSALFSGEFPISSYNEKLTWLSLDNNNIHYVSSVDLQNFPSLEYLNLDFNKIIEFPGEVIKTNSTYRLKELRLSYNYIRQLEADFLLALIELQSIDLSYNRMHNVSVGSFANLLNLVYLSLEGNILEFIAERAFRNLPKLEVLDLQENNLVELTTECFDNVSSEETNFSVNASRNKITSLSGETTVYINVLDLSYNLLEHLPKSFFHSLGPHIRHIILSYNRLTHMDAFGSLPRLQILTLHNNNITAVKRRSFAEMSSLQILDLSGNRLMQLSVEQFHNLRRLRHLRLNNNVLRSLPRDSLKNTVIEHLDLSDNQLSIFPSSALEQVGFTLRRLDIAGNYLEYLDAAMFHAITFLHELSLARNALTVLSDNTFAGLSRLRRLDISYNPIKTNFKELFHNLPKLRKLAIAGAGLKTVPHLPLANLTELNLSDNYITSYKEMDVRRLSNLRSLNVSRNRFTSLQPTMWAIFSSLTQLDISSNPLVRISRGSFEGLDRLLYLHINNLKYLDATEPRAFRPLLSLRSLELDSAVRSGSNSNISNIVASSANIESLILHEKNLVLNLQLAGLNAPKLRILEVRGASLKRVTSYAFQSLGRQRALAIRLTGSSISTLPPGLIRPLARVPHFALDLSDNKLVTISPAVFYPNLTGWNRFATKLLSGGLILTGNPLRCGCSVSWIGAWLRRWTAEVGGGTHEAREAARSARCVGPSGSSVLLSLDSDEAECHASALSSRAFRPVAKHLTFAWIVLLYSIS